MENIKKYLLSLLTPKEVKDFEMGDTTIEILKYIAVNPSTSVYDCYKYLNKYRLKNKTIAYKNVYFNVHKLLQFGFIQKVIDPNKNIYTYRCIKSQLSYITST